MDLSITYIISQVFAIIMYAFLALTYYAKDRNKVLTLNFLALTAAIIEYILLNAWTGAAMCVIALMRNAIFLIDEKKNGKREKITKKDIIILIILCIILTIFTVFTYDGLLSLLSVLATAICTFSVWQKDVKIYKLLGIPVEILWILYNIYIKSIMGTILEFVMLICAIMGYVLEIRKNKNICKEF